MTDDFSDLIVGSEPDAVDVVVLNGVGLARVFFNNWRLSCEFFRCANANPSARVNAFVCRFVAVDLEVVAVGAVVVVGFAISLDVGLLAFTQRVALSYS